MLVALLLAAAPPGTTWVGDTVTAGSSPVQLCVDAWSPDEAVVEIWWHAYGRVTAEQPVPHQRGEFDARIPDPHPIYEYTDPTRVRCELRDDDLWCKLSYTGWFQMRRGEPGCAANRSAAG